MRYKELTQIFLGTHKDNMVDMANKGRQFMQRLKKQGLRYHRGIKPYEIGYIPVEREQTFCGGRIKEAK